MEGIGEKQTTQKVEKKKQMKKKKRFQTLSNS